MLWWIIGLAAGLIFLILAISFICFMMAFFADRRPEKNPPEFPIPPGEIYEPHREQMIQWIKETRALPCREYTVTARDGLILKGKYYEYAPGAPIELMFHGYRGNAERDLCGGVQRCFAIGRSALIVDQRGCGQSEGHVITFGIKERLDCLCWLELMIQEFGPEVRIILTGISMGAATVLMAGAEKLPPQVKGILADCGYSSAQAIIKKVIRQMHLPADLLYPFVRLGARLFGGFDPEETSPLEAMEKCALPVIFFHGDKDDFVPCEMSEENFAACTARKQLVKIPGAGHGLAFPVDQALYLKELGAFFAEL